LSIDLCRKFPLEMKISCRELQITDNLFLVGQCCLLTGKPPYRSKFWFVLISVQGAHMLGYCGTGYVIEVRYERKGLHSRE
jgi:hypothetical protein